MVYASPMTHSLTTSYFSLCLGTLFFLGSSLSSIASAQMRCSPLYVSSTEAEIEASWLVDKDLFQLEQDALNSQKTEAQISQENQKRLAHMMTLPARGADWKDLNIKEAEALVSSIEHNRVTGNQYRYEREGIEMGYCFGRATYVHLKALSLGYRKDQIKKIWAVGPMKTNESSWRYHVATMIRSLDNSWYVIDNEFHRPLLVGDWVARMKLTSTNKKLHFFISNPEKFGPFPGKYTRHELGLNQERDQDYYRGYFSDLMLSLRN